MTARKWIPPASASADVPEQADVVVVGAGPAGLAAATEIALRSTLSVVVLDRESKAGGIPRHCNHYPFGVRELHRLLRGPDYAARLVARAINAGVTLCTGVSVMALQAGPRLQITTAHGSATLDAQRVILCTGVRETSRAARLIGGTRPAGVLSTGALQALVFLNRQRPFERPVILGSELVSFSSILTCRHLGIRPAAMIETGQRITARSPCALLPRLSGIPLLLGTTLESIEGRDRVTGVTLRNSRGTTRQIPTDGVIVSGEFKPEASLLRVSHLAIDTASGGPVVDQCGRCSDPHYFAAGNLLRPVETAGWSWHEGRLTGRAVMDSFDDGLLPGGPCLELTLSSDALNYVVPQRFAATSEPSATGRSLQPGAKRAVIAVPALQLRVTRPVSGQLVLRLNGVSLSTHRLHSRPERRITLPLSLIPANAQGVLDLGLRERSQ